MGVCDESGNIGTLEVPLLWAVKVCESYFMG